MKVMTCKHGFGLVSTIVAMVLLGIVVTALSSSGMYVMAVYTDSSTRSAATAIASTYLEEIKARQVKSLVSDISYVDPNEGIRMRGYTIPEMLEK